MGTDAVDAKLIMELRSRTGLPVLTCKQALLNARGDIDAAAKFLLSQGVDCFNLSGLMEEAARLRKQRGENPGKN